ncbi:MAG: hypothetical protein CM15mP73_5510 [Hyphomicrobiales bacterium]|nr:MAG: hypothetical protein CM15mP73_5510 [Hyphomicrobiales bacterium]
MKKLTLWIGVPILIHGSDKCWGFIHRGTFYDNKKIQNKLKSFGESFTESPLANYFSLFKRNGKLAHMIAVTIYPPFLDGKGYFDPSAFLGEGGFKDGKKKGLAIMDQEGPKSQF